MTVSRIDYLFNLYLNDDCTPGEKSELMDLLRDPANESLFRKHIQEVIDNTGPEKEMRFATASMILNGIFEADKIDKAGQNDEAGENDRTRELTGEKIIPLKTWMKVAAAVVCIIIAGSIYKLQTNDRDKGQKSAQLATKSNPTQIVPGSDKAILTMGDGSVITLDSVGNGNIAVAGHSDILKNGGSLVYNAANQANKTTLSYNTLSTPRGGQYRVVLSDGSQVWLNAASSLRFPLAFNGDTRQVELTGEAYFEVAKDAKKPFEVLVGDMNIRVIGTHFNVNAYSEEESIKTSLLEGSVKVSRGSSSNLLKPGQQASLFSENNIITVKSANMDAVVAWKNGLFEFEGADINTILRQIARWYDIEIVSNGKIASREFEGKISRDAQLEDVLRILELSNIRFRTEGKKIIVL